MSPNAPSDVCRCGHDHLSIDGYPMDICTECECLSWEGLPDGVVSIRLGRMPIDIPCVCEACGNLITSHIHLLPAVGVFHRECVNRKADQC